MTGIVFTEPSEMADQAVGKEALGCLLDQLDVEAGVAYASVRNPLFGELERIIDAIGHKAHSEVPKLYPDAEVSKFETIWWDDKALRLSYCSGGPLGPLCHVSILACGDFFGQWAALFVEHFSSLEAVFEVRLEN